MAWDDGLNPGTPAYNIAADTSKKVRVLAGPGTGKSYAIKKRITRLLDEGIPPESILAVTFTRMSAADLVRDIRTLGVAGAEDVRVSTLHSECFRILGKNSVITITGRNPRPLAAFELEPLLADLRSFAGGRDKKAMRKLIAAYESAWARLQHEIPGTAAATEDIVFEDALVAWLTFHRGMLIGELVPFAYRYLRDNPAAPELTKYSHVLVDEYQDLNRAEQEVAAQLASNGNLIIVGDDDQSIYTFKNAHRIGIIDFPKSHPGTNSHTMDECQRCPGLVISLANSLIARNKTRPTPLRSLRPLPKNGNGIVEVFQFPRHSDEMDYLYSRISKFINVDKVPPGQIIVLCQNKSYIRPLYDRLRSAGLPAEFCYQESQLDEPDATERMALLSLTGDKEDRVALRYLIGFGSDTWLSKQWTQLREASENEGKSPLEILEEMSKGARSITGFSQMVARFKQIEGQLGLLQSLTGMALVDAWIPAGGTSQELREIAEKVATLSPTCDASTLAESVRDVITEPSIPDIVPDVRIMSLHKSKGLSANVVILAGCVEGVLPRERRKDMTDAEYAESIEEYRRLVFVGLTRVKAAVSDNKLGHLIVSASRKIPIAIAMKGVTTSSLSGGVGTTITSRFLQELGPDSPKPVNPLAL